MVFRYAAGLPDVEGLADGSGAEVLAVSCESDNGPLEHIVVYKEGVRTIPTPCPVTATPSMLLPVLVPSLVGRNKTKTAFVNRTCCTALPNPLPL